MKKRLFTAIALPDELRAGLSSFAKREADAWPGASWTAPDDLHVTVVFIGGVDETLIPDLTAALRGVIRERKPPELEFASVTLAPPRGSRRTMIWASFVENADFSGLAEAVRGAAGPFAPKMPEALAPLPHATLARLERPVAAGSRDFGEIRPAMRRFAAREIVLYESHLGAGGPRYRPLAVFKTSDHQVS